MGKLVVCFTESASFSRKLTTQTASAWESLGLQDISRWGPSEPEVFPSQWPTSSHSETLWFFSHAHPHLCLYDPSVQMSFAFEYSQEMSNSWKGTYSILLLSRRDFSITYTMALSAYSKSHDGGHLIHTYWAMHTEEIPSPKPARKHTVNLDHELNLHSLWHLAQVVI
jgi:hypothetical protein